MSMTMMIMRSTDEGGADLGDHGRCELVGIHEHEAEA